MTISKRDTKLLLMLLGIIILMATYLAVYNPYISKTEAVQAETAAIKPELTELEGYYENLSTYQAEIESFRQTIEDELKNYPTQIRPEDLVMYAIGLEDSIGLNISSIAFSQTEPMMPLQLPQQDESGLFSLREASAYHSGMTISFALGYQQLKDTIDYLAKTDKRTALDTISVSFNAEDGGLLGTATINKYFVAGPDETYVETIVPNVPIGTDDLFGTFTAVAADGA